MTKAGEIDPPCRSTISVVRSSRYDEQAWVQEIEPFSTTTVPSPLRLDRDVKSGTTLPSVSFLQRLATLTKATVPFFFPSVFEAVRGGRPSCSTATLASSS